MTPEQLASYIAIVLSLAFGYIPGLKNWYASLSSEYRALTMGALLLVVSAGALAYNCQFQVACLQSNWQSYASVLISALVANQATYLLAVKPSKK